MLGFPDKSPLKYRIQAWKKKPKLREILECPQLHQQQAVQPHAGCPLPAMLAMPAQHSEAGTAHLSGDSLPHPGQISCSFGHLLGLRV